jgi:bifunctional ADP-heptose synthase (sugar kinase/adenylyltransferase)
MGVSFANNFQTENNKIELLIEYETVTQKVLFRNDVLAALISGRKYDVISQNGDYSRESII